MPHAAQMDLSRLKGKPGVKSEADSLLAGESGKNFIEIGKRFKFQPAMLVVT
jgi:hypothetical protein